MILLMFLMIIGSFLELLGVAVFQPFVNVIMNPGSIAETPWLSMLDRLFVCKTTEGFLTVLAVCIIFIYLRDQKHLSLAGAELHSGLYLWCTAETVYQIIDNISE